MTPTSDDFGDVSVVICVRNTAGMLRENLPAVRKELPDVELIVVDGNSTDGSVEIAAQYARVVSDEGKGLAFARQLGITSASRPFVVFAGPDNRMSRTLVSAMRRALQGNERLAGVAPQTDVMNERTYWERTTKYFFRYFINKPGFANVIGTPCMFKRDVILRVPYDVSISAASDDTDLALRLLEAGYTLEILDVYTEEKSDLDRAAFIVRWKWYGKGDAEFYAKHKRSWTFIRRCQSLFHPLYKYGIRGTWILLRNGKPQYVPGMFVAIWARYAGWMAHARRLRGSR